MTSSWKVRPARHARTPPPLNPVGACDGSLACSTCHVVLEQATYDALPAPCIEEEDMLDLAFGLTQTSRLGCQVKLARALDGMRVTLPHATRNMAVDGFKPKPH